MKLEQIFQNNLYYLLNSTTLTSQKIAVAISGGADSVALALLLLNLAKSQSISVTFLTVNHNLRPEASEEVKFVQTLAENMNVPCIALSWNHNNEYHNLQERAREGRYDLLTNTCNRLNIKLLLTAHQQDDMIETFLMRKRRKSGLWGLKEQYKNFRNEVQILRPLFNITKQTLIKYLESRKQNWVEDLSNYSDKYERNRIRQDIVAMSVAKRKEILVEINKVNEEAKHLNQQFIHMLAESTAFYSYGCATINMEICRKAKYEIQLQLLNYVLTIIGGSINIPRYRNSSKIIHNINKDIRISHSLNNCILRENGDKLLIYKEKQFINKERVVLTPNHKFIWDNRFLLLINSSIVQNYSVSAMEMSDYLQVKKYFNLDNLKKIGSNSHKEILFTLPVIKKLEKVIAIPHISYYDDIELKNNIDIIFRPNFISRFTHFC